MDSETMEQPISGGRPETQSDHPEAEGAGQANVMPKPPRLRQLLERLGLMPSPPVGRSYHAFISYSHAADGKLAPALQKGLQQFAKPWYQARALHVFRDDASMSINANLWGEIERSLDDSAFYILLASPDAAKSRWVADEAARWKQTKPSDNLFVALTDGELVWDKQHRDFDWERTNALPPVLERTFTNEPRFIDLRWARNDNDLSLHNTRFREAIADLAAPLHGKPKDELASEEVVQQRRWVRIRRAAVAALATLTTLAIVAGVLALIERASAITEAHTAESQLLATQSQNDHNLELASLQALEAYRVSPTTEAQAAITTLAQGSPQIGLPLAVGNGKVDAVAFSPDGRELATGDERGAIELWDVATHRQIGPTLNAGDRVLSIAFSPNGRTLVSGDDGGSVRFWDVTSGRAIGPPVRADSTYVATVAFSPKGEMVASAGVDGVVRMWDVATHNELGLPLVGDGREIDGIAFSPDGRTLAAGNAAGAVSLWNVATDRRIGPPLLGHTDTISAVAFSPNGEILASASNDHTVRLWDVRTHREVGGPLTGAGDWVTSVAFSPDGRTVVAGSYDHTLRLWDVASHRELLTIPVGLNQNWVLSVAFSPAGSTVAAGSSDGTVTLFDVTGSEQGAPLTGHTNWVDSVAFSPDGRLLASGSVDRTIRIWDLATHRQVGTPLTGDSDTVDSVAFRPSGGLLASGSYDGTVRIWDVASHRERGAPLIARPTSGDQVEVAFSPIGRILASGTIDSIRLWDVRTERELGSPIRVGGQISGAWPSAQTAGCSPPGATG